MKLGPTLIEGNSVTTPVAGFSRPTALGMNNAEVALHRELSHGHGRCDVAWALWVRQP